MTLVERLYLLLIFSLPIARPFGVEISGFTMPATDVIFVSAAVAGGIAVALGRRPVVWSSFYGLLALYVLALACSALASDHEQASVVKLLGTTYLASLAILTVNVVRSWAFLRAVVSAWIAGTAVTVLFGVLAVFSFYAGRSDLAQVFGLTHFGSLPAGHYPRVTALFRNMNMLCNYLIPSLMLVLTMRALGWLAPLGSRLLVAGIWFTAIFTVSTGLGGLLVAASEWRWLRTPSTMRGPMSRLLRVSAIVGALALIFAATVLPVSRGGDQGITVPGSELAFEAAPRVMVWRSAFATFFAHPLVGQGLGTPVASHRFVTLSGQEQHLRDAHNVWLNLAGQGGILTLAAFAALVASIARRCVAHWGRSEPTAVVQTGLGLSLLGAFVYHGLTGSFEDARHLWVLAGLVVAIHQGLEPEPRVPRWA